MQSTAWEMTDMFFVLFFFVFLQVILNKLTELGGHEGRSPPLPPRTKIYSFLCTFREILVKWYVGAPVWEILDPLLNSSEAHVFSS